jgi:hypothetical protein
MAVGLLPVQAACRDGVHDALRYTLVFENSDYTAAVKVLEKRLLSEPRWGVHKIKFKNYWCTENDQTTCVVLRVAQW